MPVVRYNGVSLNVRHTYARKVKAALDAYREHNASGAEERTGVPAHLVARWAKKVGIAHSREFVMRMASSGLSASEVRARDRRIRHLIEHAGLTMEAVCTVVGCDRTVVRHALKETDETQRERANRRLWEHRGTRGKERLEEILPVVRAVAAERQRQRAEGKKGHFVYAPVAREMGLDQKYVRRCWHSNLNPYVEEEA